MYYLHRTSRFLLSGKNKMSPWISSNNIYLINANSKKSIYYETYVFEKIWRVIQLSILD